MGILRILVDGYPTFRPDVSAIFGRYLPRWTSVPALPLQC
jgi:hypothetical protein